VTFVVRTYRILVVTGVGTGGWASKIATDRISEELGKRRFKVEMKKYMVAGPRRARNVSSISELALAVFPL